MAKNSVKKKTSPQPNADTLNAKSAKNAQGKDLKKKIDEYQQTKPVQLSLFEMLLPEEKKFSNTVELYDFIGV